MDIIISGYGKMGKMVEQEALKRGDTILAKIDTGEDWAGLDAISAESLKEAVVVDFSTPDSVLANIEECFRRGIPIVVGTTGWYGEKERLKEKCEKGNHAMFWASNFSIGVFLFNRLNSYLAKIMNPHSQYEASITEIHHIHKLDAPSGTAISLAETLLENLERKTTWALNSKGEKEVLNIEAVREGEVCGTHIIDYVSEVDEIEIRHSAKSRQGFAAGAVMAAHWLQGRKGFFTMSDMLD